MKTDYIYHYSALDLKAGASKEEIHSAFRRLAKLYHPDQDSSTYAAMRYKEIRAAYDVLRQKTEHLETGAAESSPPPSSSSPNTDYGATGKDHGTVYGKNWYYVEDEDESEEDENATIEYSDLLWKYDRGVRLNKKRLPFSLDNLPDILRISLNQVFGISMAIRVFLAVLMLWRTLTWVGWGNIWVAGTILCILLGGLLNRYYFPCPPQEPDSNFSASFLFTIALSVLCAVTTHQTYFYMYVHEGWVRYYGGGLILVLLFFEIFLGLFWLWAAPEILFITWGVPFFWFMWFR